MKALFITLGLSLLFASNGFAGTATVYTNDDESGIVIEGEAAKTVYEKMDVQEKKEDISKEYYSKSGKDLDCSKDANDAKNVTYSCHLVLIEVEGTGGTKFTGEIGSK